MKLKSTEEISMNKLYDTIHECETKKRKLTKKQINKQVERYKKGLNIK